IAAAIFFCRAFEALTPLDRFRVLDTRALFTIASFLRNSYGAALRRILIHGIVLIGQSLHLPSPVHAVLPVLFALFAFLVAIPPHEGLPARRRGFAPLPGAMIGAP